MNWIWLIVSYAAMEIIINVVFHYVSTRMESEENRFLSISKGILERLFLITGLLSGYPQVIIAFGAIKIGTRFQKNTKISNDYFLIGNFVSMLTALVYSQLVMTFIL